MAIDGEFPATLDATKNAYQLVRLGLGETLTRLDTHMKLVPWLAKDISKLVRDAVPRAKAQIQGDAVRVSSKSKDDLQRVIGAVKDKNYDVPLQFVNYR